MIDPGKLDRRVTLLKVGISSSNISEELTAFTSRVTNEFGEVESESCLTTDLEALGGKEQDYYGQKVREYETLAQVWAKVDYRSVPKEGEETDKLTSVNKVRFTIRYRSDVDATTKISWNGNTYEIEGVSLEGRERYLILDTTLRD